jgi:hypothetical protein
MTDELQLKYSAYSVVNACVNVWRDLQCDFNKQFSTKDTLEFIKEKCEEYELSEEIVKELFDENEYPFVYCLKTKEILNSEEEEEDSEKEKEEEN